MQNRCRIILSAIVSVNFQLHLREFSRPVSGLTAGANGARLRHLTNVKTWDIAESMCLCCSLATFLCLIFACSSVAPAQSRRKPDDPKPASTKDHGAGNNRTSTQLTFLVVTPTPPPPAENQPQTPDYSHQIRGACISELGRVKGVRAMEDEDISSREARELAQIETGAYVIWIELKWVGATQYSQTPFRLRYLVLEPGSGKTLASGYGTPTFFAPSRLYEK